jgi:hypothetical protein
MDTDGTGSSVIEPPAPEAERRQDSPTEHVLPLDPAAGLTPLLAGAGAEPVALDWSGTGRLDLLVSAESGPQGRTVRLFRQLPPSGDRPARFEEGERIDGLEDLRGLCPLPNGKPSRFDLAALAPEGLVLIANEGTADAPRFDGPRRLLGIAADLGVGPGRIAQIVADDWDGDGTMDLLIGFDDLSDYWPADLAALPVHQRAGFNQVGGHPAYDRAGKWRGREARGRLFWLRNVGQPGEPRFEPPEEITAEAGRVAIGPHPAPLAVAWGAARGVELLVADDAGTVRLHRNFGGQRPPVLLEPRPLRSGDEPLGLPEDRTTVTTADLDGDGRAELIVGAADGRVFVIRSGRARDEALSPEPLRAEGHALRFGGGAVAAVADLDGDGDLDLIVGDISGRLWLAEDVGGVGDHRYRAPVELEAGGLPFRLDPGPDGRFEGPITPPLGHAAPAIADWDGNGRPDLIVAGAGGEVLFFHHNGGPTQPRFERPAPVRCAGGPLVLPPCVRPAAVDWLGSGQLDLIALDLQGFLSVYARTGANEVAAPKPLTDRLGRFLRLDGAFGQSGRCTLWAGPWTGSGRTDVLVGLPRGSRHVVASVAGLPLDEADALPTVLLLEQDERGRMIPRPVFRADGRPVVVGHAGCSPCGVDWSGDGTLDLLVGADDGRVIVLRRDALRW